MAERPSTPPAPGSAAWALALQPDSDWAQAPDALRAAVNEASQALGLAPQPVGSTVPVGALVDVRRPAAYAQARHDIAQARRGEPGALAQWAGSLPAGQVVLVYCVHGHEVSRSAALWLRATGVQAYFLAGGITAWQAAGLPLQARA